MSVGSAPPTWPVSWSGLRKPRLVHRRPRTVTKFTRALCLPQPLRSRLRSGFAGHGSPLYHPRKSDAEMPHDSIEQVILRRGSARRFAQVPISLAQFSTMLDRATRGVPADFLDPPGAQLNQLYLIVHAVEGLESGAYVFYRDRGVLESLKLGNFRAQAGHLGLDQELAADAAVDIFFLADLRPILQRFGNRGYRAVQLEAGVIGGKLYLGAYAQHLGATGLTFYDDEVTRFFSPHAADKSAIFFVAVGRSVKAKG